ncbi:MAG: trimethylamine corrinoid protein 2 [Armatimonadota bacterium]|nr:trimethylamine corrinoid protein 2 [Armatimonadota bacterium]
MIKPDWDKSRERFEAWWNRGCVDRVLLQVLAPQNAAAQAKPPQPETLEEQWLDADYRIRAFEYRLATTHYGGDAFPYFDTHIGPGTLALYLGSEPSFAPDTVWYNPCIDDIATASVPEYDENNRYWQATLQMVTNGVECFKDRALVSFPDLIEGLDIIASLVGTDRLLMYLVDAPEHVHRFQRALVDRYFDYYDRLYPIIKDDIGGTCFSAFQTYAPGRMAKVQCDFSAMISPSMFEEFVAPYLAEQCSRLDYSVFHLDGPCCLQHLDILLSIDELDAIQWTPGAGQPCACDESHIPIYRRIRAAGKSCMVRGGNPDQARNLVEELGPEGLDIAISVSSPEEADEVVRQSFHWRKL